MENSLENQGIPQNPPPNPNFYTQKPTHRQVPHPKKKSNGCLWWGIGIFVFIFIMGCGIMLIAILAVFSTESSSALSGSTSHQFTEEFSSGSYFSNNKIAVIHVNGIITSAEGSWSSGIANSGFIVSQIKAAGKDPNVKAIILRLNTPGGEVTAADDIYHQLMLLKKNTKKPIIASMGSVAASGGVYVAVAADHIVANKLTTTGSIGVIAQTYNYQELFKKVGLKAETYTSGPMKDLLNGARPRTEEEIEIIQEIIETVYGDFVKIVAKGRPKLTEDQIRNTKIGDGRIFTGKQAFDLGLVDQLGYFEDAVNVAVKKAGLKKNDYQVVNYTKRLGLADLLFMEAKDTKIKVELPGTPLKSTIPESGKFFFLPTSW